MIFSDPPIADMDFSILSGSFAIKDGVTYRETGYWHEAALFALHDTEKKTELARVPLESLQERFIAFAQCDIEGVRYKIQKIQGGHCYYSTFLENGIILHKPLREISEIWIQRNYGNGRIGIEVIYQKLGISVLPSDRKFYLEEMHSGKLMLSYLDELLSVPRTKEELGKFYGVRIWFGEADLAGLITDEYISRMKIDNEEFDFTQDLAYGLIAISAVSSNGNHYIREICETFNQLSDPAAR